jgi:hypothetical protein
LVRNLEKSSIIVSVIVLLFLSYGHFYNLLGDLLGNPVRHRYLAAAEGVVLLVITILVLKKAQVARVIAQFLSVASFVLLAMALFESVRYDVGVYRAISAAAKKETNRAQALSNSHLPDFYLIILDAHTRSDVLASRFGYDNSDFIRQLGEMGFYVGKCSQSNYASTKLSLVSALYGNYIQDIVQPGAELPPLKTSTLNQTLKSLGYKSIAFENRASGHFDLKEDILLSRHQVAFGKFDLRGGTNEFESMMLDTSFMRFVIDTELIPGIDRDALWDWELLEHYYQTQYILSELEKLPEIPGPKFVFAHIMVPHSPFVFAPDGSFKRNDSPIDGYRSNAEFIDNRLPSILRTIIEKSNPTPIIVVMGDHGPSTRKTITKQMRMSNLGAYLVNQAAKAQMYPSMTPVNGFRIILDAQYGGNYPLLKDVSYYAYKPSQVPDAEVIANECQPSQ